MGELFAHGSVDTGDGNLLRDVDEVRDKYGVVILYPDGTWRFAHRLMCDHRPGDTSHHLRG